jgi:hypothetical protein
MADNAERTFLPGSRSGPLITGAVLAGGGATGTSAGQAREQADEADGQ